MANEEVPRGRINVSVAVLEERLRLWSESVQRSMDSLREDLRRRDERYENQIASLIIWQAQHILEYNVLVADIKSVKHELDEKIKKDIALLKEQEDRGKVSFKAKTDLLRMQWTWLMAGVFAASTVLGIALQLKIISLG